MHEAERADQHASVEEFARECCECEESGLLPRGTSASLFRENCSPLRWLRSNDLQLETMKVIAETIIYAHLPRTQQDAVRSNQAERTRNLRPVHAQDETSTNALELVEESSAIIRVQDQDRADQSRFFTYLEGEVSHLQGTVLPDLKFKLPVVTVFYSKHNAGVAELLGLLQSVFGDRLSFKPLNDASPIANAIAVRGLKRNRTRLRARSKSTRSEESNPPSTDVEAPADAVASGMERDTRAAVGPVFVPALVSASKRDTGAAVEGVMKVERGVLFRPSLMRHVAGAAGSRSRQSLPMAFENKEHFLVLLNPQVFSEGPTLKALVQQLSHALARGRVPVLVHDRRGRLNAIPFADIFFSASQAMGRKSTELFSTIALPWHGAPHESVFVATLAKALGAEVRPKSLKQLQNLLRVNKVLSASKVA